MYPKTKQAALAAGLEFYETAPCLRGHAPTIRFAKNGNCVLCNRERAASAYNVVRSAREQDKDARRVVLSTFASLPRTRKQAKHVGVSMYYTGLTCTNGHLSPKSAVKGTCLVCQREWAQRKRRETDPLQLKRQDKAHRDKRRDKRLADAKKWRELHKERIAEYNKVYRRMFALPAGVVPRHAAIVRATPKCLPLTDRHTIEAIYQQAQSMPGYQVDHIVPLNGGFVMGLHVPANLRIVPVSDNAAKRNKFNNTCPRGFWEIMPEQEQTVFAEALFEHFRTVGFPYYPTYSDDAIHRTVAKCRSGLSRASYMDGDALVSNYSGLDAVNGFFNHMFDTRCAGGATPVEAFNNDAILRRAVVGRLKTGDYMSGAGLRKFLCSSNGVQRATNFRPITAAALYKKYAGENSSVFDPCAGWGGRLMGAAIAPNVRRYVGIDAAKKTVAQLQLFASKIAPFINADIIFGAQEDWVSDEVFDMVLTSPPYYDCELYSSDPTQSSARYASPEQWREGFLRPLMRQVHSRLRAGGVFCLNIANVKTYPNLLDHAKEDAIAAGFVLEATYRYMLPSAFKGSNAKSEPVLVWRR